MTVQGHDWMLLRKRSVTQRVKRIIQQKKKKKKRLNENVQQKNAK